MLEKIIIYASSKRTSSSTSLPPGKEVSNAPNFLAKKQHTYDYFWSKPIDIHKMHHAKKTKIGKLTKGDN